MSQQQMSENTSEISICEVKYSPAAVRDLDRVWLDVYEASLSYDIAETYLNDFMDKIECKDMFPESGAPLYYGNYFTGYYFVAFKAYIAFYRKEENFMLVDRILLGKSDYMSTLGFIL